MTILEELYMGNIDFATRHYPPDSRFVKAAKKRAEIMEKLTVTLNDEEKELLGQLGEAEGDIEDIVRYDIYIAALKFGVLLMSEIFTAKNKAQ